MALMECGNGNEQVCGFAERTVKDFTLDALRMILSETRGLKEK